MCTIGGQHIHFLYVLPVTWAYVWLQIYVCYSMSLYLTILMCVGLWCVMWCEGSQGPGQGPGCLHTTSHTTDQHTSRWSSTKTYCSIHILKPDRFWNSGLTGGRFGETFSEIWVWNLGHVQFLKVAMFRLCRQYEVEHFFKIILSGLVRKFNRSIRLRCSELA